MLVAYVLRLIHLLHLVNALNVIDFVEHCCEFSHRVNEECDGAIDDGIFCDGVERVNAEVKLVGDCVDDIDEEMIAVDGTNGYRDWINFILALLKINIHNGIAML